ncbi:ATP-dependent DNA helicase RecQ [Bacillus sporothermodurans]|nr:ATP-dependent DNA helicase RecQ [Heyndrickxia sporothermodurans]MBL5779642.1 ATP-dependent DNA helicase RecQ [Heyndrickxia sporothermodurans]
MKIKLYDHLNKQFGYDMFRIGQEEVITSVLEGKHTLAVLPTGTGKSLCYQLPGYLLKGIVIIVSPLLSLMQDQVEQLKINGEKRVTALNSFLESKERKQIIHSLQNYRFIYTSPEMLTNNEILQKLKQMEISLFVVDEAHCISQWGPDFRPDYLNLSMIRSELKNPTTLALTATATEDVRADIIKHLNLDNVNQLIYSVDRPNIALVVEETTNYNDKVNKLLQFVKQLQKPGIIYFSSKRLTEEMAALLRNNGIAQTAAYHGGMDREQRILIQQQFLHNQLQVICATSAFGMGVNKGNIRFVIHFHMPYQLDSYLQEIGRAGRDGKKSIAVLLYSPGDEFLPLQIFENELPSDDQIEQFFLLNKNSNEESLLNLTEIQLRFLTYYQKKYERSEVAKRVKRIRDFRIQYKQKKLNEMVKWVKSTTCRREGILRYFQEQKVTNVKDCCDVCGVHIENYQTYIPENVKGQNENWQLLLKNLLIRGDEK